MSVSLREVFTPFFSYLLLFTRTRAYGDRPFAELRRDIDRLLQEQKLTVRRHDVAAPEYENASFAAVAWADELVLSSTHGANRELYEQWKRRPLQVDLFNTANAGEEFFDRLERLNAQQREVCEIYHLCLCLGFRGRYYDESQAFRILEMRRELAQRLPCTFPDLLEIEKKKEQVTPQPYTAKPVALRPPRVPSVTWAWAAVPVIALVLLYALWPAPPPPPELPAGRSREEIIADVESRLHDFQCCSLTVADFDSGALALEGRVESEEQREHVRTAAREVPEVTSVRDTVTVIPRPFCEVMALLAPFQHMSDDGEDLAVRPRKGCDAVYYARENLLLDISSTRPLDYVYVDYYVADREYVAHILPSPEQRTNFLQGATALAIGEPGSKAQWQIEPPYGLEMVTVVATAEPLFAQPRLAPELAGEYIQELRKALPAEGGGGAASAAYCFIRTQER